MYDIDRCDTKKIENFVLPKSVLQLKTKRGEKLFVVKNFDLETNEIEYYSKECECLEIKGTLDSKKNLHVTYFEIYGGGSGIFWEDYYVDVIFPQTTGIFKAKLVWEGGDTVEIITLCDGVLETIEL